MSHDRPSRPSPAERQNARAVAVQAAATLTAAEFMRNPEMNLQEMNVALQQRTSQILDFIQSGWWR